MVRLVVAVVVAVVVGDGRFRGWQKFGLESHLLSGRRGEEEMGRGCLGISISLGSAGGRGQGGTAVGKIKRWGRKEPL